MPDDWDRAAKAFQKRHVIDEYHDAQNHLELVNRLIRQNLDYLNLLPDAEQFLEQTRAAWRITFGAEPPSVTHVWVNNRLFTTLDGEPPEAEGD